MHINRSLCRRVALGASLLVLAGVPAAAQAASGSSKHSKKPHHSKKHSPASKHSKK